MQHPRELVGVDAANAVVAWALVAVLLADVLASLAFGDFLWAGFALVVLGVAIAPAVLRRDHRAVVAWQAIALCALPMWAQTLGIYAQPMGYVALAALALLIVVELEAFTVVEMPSWFAVLFVVLTTVAVACVWGVVQYVADALLGTGFIADPDALMWDLIFATVVGVAAAVVFEVYFSPRGLLGVLEEEIES